MRSLLLICLFISIYSFNKAQADDTKIADAIETTQEAVTEARQKISDYLGDSQKRRGNANYFALLSYSPFDLLIPSKKGLTLGLISSTDKTWEFEYLNGNVSVPFIIEDLGKMSDTRYSLIARSYFGSNSFNISYGVTYFDFSLHLGDKLLNGLTGGAYPSVDLVEIESLGLNVAVGNRWSFEKNITFGVDWISLAQPLYTLKKNSAFLDYSSNQQDKDDVSKAMDLISLFPRIVLFKVQLGILF